MADTERPDDTTLRHEVRWIAASLPPVPEQIARVREAMALMSDDVRAYETARIREKVPVWADALEAANAAQ